MNDDFDFRVRINLRTKYIYDVESRLIEINQLRSWLDELTEWQPDMYSLRFQMVSGQQVVVWFKEEGHAILCTLRWG